jgi:hypothetical protein
MTAKGLKYAEESLGVHSVYEDLVSARARLEDALKRLTYARDLKRGQESVMMEAKMLLISDERGKHPEHSEAALDRHTKSLLATDTGMKEHARQQRNFENMVDTADADVETAKADIRIGSARLEELGGYFQYLAALKTAKPAKPEEPAEPAVQA